MKYQVLMSILKGNDTSDAVAYDLKIPVMSSTGHLNSLVNDGVLKRPKPNYFEINHDEMISFLIKEYEYLEQYRDAVTFEIPCITDDCKNIDRVRHKCKLPAIEVNDQKMCVSFVPDYDYRKRQLHEMVSTK